MFSENQLSQSDRLNKNNYDEWQFLIGNILKSKKIFIYAKEDVISSLRAKVEESKHKNGGVAEKNLLTELEDAEAQDALAASIISTNVSRECLEHIKTLDTAFEIMQKLKTLYQGSESSDIQHWMKKLYSLKAKSLTDCKDVLHQISEIFSVLESNNSNLGDWEKTRIIYYSLPQCMRTQIHPDGTKKIKDFLTEVNNKVNFQIYLQKNIKYNQSIINNEQDDLMDIDFVGRRSKNDSSNQYSS
ncbi:hypothetical protein BCR36DRAFT_322632, partial [Piromyces finnis]